MADYKTILANSEVLDKIASQLPPQPPKPQPKPARDFAAELRALKTTQTKPIDTMLDVLKSVPYSFHPDDAAKYLIDYIDNLTLNNLVGLADYVESKKMTLSIRYRRRYIVDGIKKGWISNLENRGKHLLELMAAQLKTNDLSTEQKAKDAIS